MTPAVVDFHVHVFPDDLAASALPRLSALSGLPPRFDGTVAGLLRSMRRSAVDLTVVQPVATKPSQVRRINEWCRDLRAHAGLTSFGALHPDLAREALQEEVRCLQAEGFRGVKLHPNYQAFQPDEDRLEPLYQALAAAGLAVLFHVGVDLGCDPPVRATPAHIAGIQRAFPGLVLIAAHLGGFRMWDEVERNLVGTPVWLDTAFCAGQCPPEVFRDIVRAHGSHRVLLASDGPWGDPGDTRAYLRAAGLAPEEILAIEGKNASALLAERKE